MGLYHLGRMKRRFCVRGLSSAMWRSIPRDQTPRLREETAHLRHPGQEAYTTGSAPLSLRLKRTFRAENAHAEYMDWGLRVRGQKNCPRIPL